MRHYLQELVNKKAKDENRDKPISKREIARMSGVPRPTVIYWLNNPELARFDGKVASRFCRYLDCNLDDLVEFTEGE